MAAAHPGRCGDRSVFCGGLTGQRRLWGQCKVCALRRHSRSGARSFFGRRPKETYWQSLLRPGLGARRCDGKRSGGRALQPCPCHHTCSRTGRCRHHQGSGPARGIELLGRKGAARGGLWGWSAIRLLDTGCVRFGSVQPDVRADGTKGPGHSGLRCAVRIDRVRRGPAGTSRRGWFNRHAFIAFLSPWHSLQEQEFSRSVGKFGHDDPRD